MQGVPRPAGGSESAASAHRTAAGARLRSLGSAASSQQGTGSADSGPPGGRPRTHDAVGESFEAARRQSWGDFDRSGSLLVTAAVVLLQLAVIYRLAAAGTGIAPVGVPWWRSAAAGLCAAEGLLLVAPAIAQHALGRRTYLAWRTYLVLAARGVALLLTMMRIEHVQRAVVEATLPAVFLALAPVLRLLLSSQLHNLPALSAAIVQTAALVLLLPVVASNCERAASFTTPAARRAFAAAAGRLDRYAAVMGMTVGLVYPGGGAGGAGAAGPQAIGGLGGGDAESSLCFPFLYWSLAMFGVCLPLGYQTFSDLMARQRYMRRHCGCPRCIDPDSNLQWALLVSLSVLVLYGPSLLWHLLTGSAHDP